MIHTLCSKGYESLPVGYKTRWQTSNIYRRQDYQGGVNLIFRSALILKN